MRKTLFLWESFNFASVVKRHPDVNNTFYVVVRQQAHSKCITLLHSNRNTHKVQSQLYFFLTVKLFSYSYPQKEIQ